MQHGHLKQGPWASSKWSKARAVLNYNISWLGLEMPVLLSWPCHPWLLQGRGAAAGPGMHRAWAVAGSGSAPAGSMEGTPGCPTVPAEVKFHIVALLDTESWNLWAERARWIPAATWYLSNCRSLPHLCCLHATEEKQGLRHLPKVTEPSTRATGLITAVSVARHWEIFVF